MLPGRGNCGSWRQAEGSALTASGSESNGLLATVAIVAEGWLAALHRALLGAGATDALLVDALLAHILIGHVPAGLALLLVPRLAPQLLRAVLVRPLVSLHRL